MPWVRAWQASCVLATCFLSVACERVEGGAGGRRPPVAPPILAVFTAPALLIERLETPIHAPVIGRSSPETIASDDPQVVSVERDGSLIAHKTGTTVLRAKQANTLQVEVRQIEKLSIRFDPDVMTPRQTSRIDVLGDGAPLPKQAATWTTSNAAVAWVEGDWVHTGDIDGDAVLTAMLGDRTAQITIRVESPPSGPHKLFAPKRMARGQISRFELRPQAIASDAWATSDAAILHHLGGGFFHAVAPGRSQACASIASSSEKICQTIEVTP